MISKTATSTPASSPGLFFPGTMANRPQPPLSDGTPHSSPFLHPLQMHKVRETHKAQVEQDFITGRKLINQYEIVNEIGRGAHGKVKLGRSLETGDYVAIKIVQRFSTKRRLGKVTYDPEGKTKREIAILKKIRHPNVVGLLEVIDDPDLKKIYMVLEHVELGEIIWRKKGVPSICGYERRRVEKEQRGEKDTGEEEKFFRMKQRRRQLKDYQREKISRLQIEEGPHDYWSLEHGEFEDDPEETPLERQYTHGSTQSLAHSYRSSALRSNPGSVPHSRATSRAPSRTSSRAHTPLPTEFDIPPIDSDNEDETPGPLPSIPSNHAAASALEGSYYGSYPDDPPYRGRSPSMADSIISHMSSIDDIPHDIFEEDYSYVPCFTFDQARAAFRDTVLGLEYLHYEGIVHRDIKPANLLWTKDHRVKISDFGVSYFGRPIREGETEENISEADATDFDDDLELAKTVGTPAFFAPELCYTDLDIEQPKVTEQIDVWSLGVTLYCLIFARLPFLADDEFQLFRCIAKNDVYIPRRRLKAVDPACLSSAPRTNKRIGPSSGPYRDEAELAFEEIDDELYDLLRRMLVKDPTERIKLREVKRHPWVIRGIDNILGWIDDSDPSRKTGGRRIQVDNRELEAAVVPISILDRARSMVKKGISKIISTTRSETRAEGSRRRAVSNATSSGTDSYPQPPLTPMLRDSRRASLRGDESYFASVPDLNERHREPYEHPLAQSLTASPAASNTRGAFANEFAQPHSNSVGATPHRVGSGSSTDFDKRPGPPDRTVSATTSIQTVLNRGHSHSRSVNTPPTAVQEESPISAGPFTDHNGNVFGGDLWYGNSTGRELMAEMVDEAGTFRAKSVDRGLFEAEDKHAEPTTGMSNAVAPGKLQQPSILHHPRPSRSAETSPTAVLYNKPLASPFFQPSTVQTHQTTQSSSSPSVMDTIYAASNLEERPSTANRSPEEGKSPLPRKYGTSTPETFERAQALLERKKKLEADAVQQEKDRPLPHQSEAQSDHCPLSPDDEIFIQREQDAKRERSTSSGNSTSAYTSQVASPVDFTSPISSLNLGSSEQIFTSVPSLPALVSSASSDCPDFEGEFLGRPGFVQIPDTVLSSAPTPETITPPLLSKDSTGDETETQRGTSDEDTIPNPLDGEDEEGYNGDGDHTLPMEDDDSDSDEGLTMTRSKPKKRLIPESTAMARRGTNASVGSTDTAKKVIMDG
ncbi:Serine threonine-kinase ssp1 [Hyphodiscus hymeniophilus]|uniref:non-specific serine/threonine protein kinase n=1 Tax=Hyphodiscus hymeniophilus TaxID=353542 RepID=A0A9P6SKS0_9HELO|nr:Serine threonine-kinase ssp1 [Hyphodiscus hymeniophilus]